MMEGVRIALGVSGGIAAYKALELVSLLKKAGASVRGRDDQKRLRICLSNDI